MTALPKLPEAQRPLFDKLVNVTVEVRKLDGKFGSGVVLTADGIIVTAYHVIGRSRLLRVRRLRLERKRWRVRAYGALTADVLYRDRKADIAVLKLRRPPADLLAAEMTMTEVKPNDALFRVGRDEIPLATGHLLAHAFEKRIRELEISMVCQPGGSGGPVFDELGNLVGICLRYQSDPKLPPKAHALPVPTLVSRVLRKPVVRQYFPDL